MPVKIDPDITAELAALDLVLWEAKHPKIAAVNAKTGKPTQREDKGWVLVLLHGPGVQPEARASGPTLRQAVDQALTHYFADRVPGLKGAMLRLEKATWDLQRHIAETLFAAEGGDDDSIPF